jgi:hypothetical protein
MANVFSFLCESNPGLTDYFRGREISCHNAKLPISSLLLSYSPGPGVPLALPVSIPPLIFFFFFFLRGTTAGFAP